MGANAVQNPDGTYSETTGSTANTWTNYTNAGGTQGPTIGQYATVEIACYVNGFRVADGNTYWYLVAQSPWSYHYYVSADAFYNNGQTSGSLHGTPWVDPSVPSCNAGVNGVTETTGSTANTWTNYANAGGNQGPTIGSNASVVIACAVQGFRVADGNTWWYQIASHPWNNAYYVSADAFYNNGQTSGSLKGTPFVDPAVPDCGGGGGSPGTTGETTGSVAHTWTNPANAGGSEGPSLANGQTVQITCKLTGFQVPDGNTWWYEIGSSPWSNNYYVSADAFYNNGATSGSLRGTPFVDAAVPDCTPSSGAGNVRPAGETTGSVAQTWANYSHAGGSEGQTISQGATVSVACRAQGFAVADGNTWWYLVASSPWNSVYYVSADAFYNDGATSGSLRGTPFYDPSVPICVGNYEAPLYFTSVASGRSATHSPTCTYGHYPVNCASGDFWHSFTDVSIPGRGPALDLTRTYNALLPTSAGMFGNGWTSSYDQHLSFNSDGRSDGSILITLDDGSQIEATPNGSGGFTTPASTDSIFAANSDGSYTLTLHHTSIENFNAGGQLTSISDLNGNQTTLAYDSSGHLVTVTGASGRTLTFATGSNGLISSVTDPMGRTTTYSYDGNGNLLSTTDPMGRTWAFTYDGNDRMLTMTDPRGGVVTNVYDSQGRVTQQTDPAGLTTTFAYTGDNFGDVGGTTTITDSHGNVRVEQYANGYLMQLTKAYGTSAQAQWTYTYDPTTFGQTSVTDPNGNVVSHTYNGDGLVSSTTNAAGGTTNYSYNALGELATTTTPENETTTNSYDDDGNLLSTTDPTNATTSYVYDDTRNLGLPTQITDPDGHVTTLTYDSQGDLATKTVSPQSGVSDVTSYVYDADGELVCQASANANAAGTACPAAGGAAATGTMTDAYDADGELTSSTDANGHTMTYGYDGDGNRTSTTDPNGNQTTIKYDADNRVVATVSGANTNAPATISTSYDIALGSSSCPSSGGASYCTTTTMPNGGTTTHVFDAADHEIETVLPNGNVDHFTYDGAGNKLTETTANGVTTSYAYTADNLVKSVTSTDAATPAVGYSYNADRQRSQMTDGTGTTTYSYDPDGRLLSLTNGAGATTAYVYDAAGNIASITYPNGQTVGRTYNAANELSAVTDWLGNTTHFGYDADGNLVTTTYPNGDVVRASYDQADNETSTGAYSGSSPLATIAYLRTPSNLIYQEKDAGALSGTLGNQYNAEDQLTAQGQTMLGYDADGNLTKYGKLTQSFNTADQLTKTTNPALATSYNYSYDADGNRTAALASWGRSTNYHFNGADELTSVSLPAATPSVAGVSPSSDSQAGGSVVTITGNGFTEASRVQFGNTTASGVTVISDTKLTAIAPAGPPSTVDVAVTTPGGSSQTSSADQYTYTAAPGITSVAPTAGPTKGGGTLTITGAGFTGATSVAIGKKHPTFNVVSDSTITLTMPAGSGTAKIAVATPSGTSATAAYTYANGPVITSMSATAGPTAGGNTITLYGTGFSAATAVAFGSRAATGVSIQSDNTLQVIAPAGTGTAKVIVTAPAGASKDTAADHYVYTARPAVTAVAPLSGPSDGGNTVTISGSGFTTSSNVYFGSAQAVTHYVSSTTLLAIAPSGSNATDITVQGAGGASATVPSDRYQFAPTSTSYSYNGDGLRMAGTVDGGGTSNFTWDTTPSVPEIIADGSNSYIYGPGGQVIEQIDSSGTPSYYFHDAIGSTRALLSQSGSVAATYTYSAYGSLISRTGTQMTPIEFAGAYSDEDTGLYYLVHRYYDSTTGQFVSVDPLVSTTNQSYSYASGDPANSTDPTGLWGINLCIGICLSYDSVHGVGTGLGVNISGSIGHLGAGVGAGSYQVYWDGAHSLSVGTRGLGVDETVPYGDGPSAHNTTACIGFLVSYCNALDAGGQSGTWHSPAPPSFLTSPQDNGYLRSSASYSPASLVPHWSGQITSSLNRLGC